MGLFGIHIVNNWDPTRMYDCYLVGTYLRLTPLGVYKESKYVSGRGNDIKIR